MLFGICRAAGLVGAAIVIIAYFANQQGRLRPNDWRYPLANLLGAFMILVSLYVEWNFPAAVIEVFWAAISLYGLVNLMRRKTYD